MEGEEEEEEKKRRRRRKKAPGRVIAILARHAVRVEQEMGQTWQSPAVVLNPKGGSCLALPRGDTPPGTAAPGTSHPWGSNTWPQQAGKRGRDGRAWARCRKHVARPAGTHPILLAMHCRVSLATGIPLAMPPLGPSCNAPRGPFCNRVPLAVETLLQWGLSYNGVPFCNRIPLAMPPLGPSCSGIPLAMSHGVPLATPPLGPWTTSLSVLVAITSSIFPRALVHSCLVHLLSRCFPEQCS